MRKKTRQAKTTRSSSSRSVYPPSGGKIIKQSGQAHISPVMKYRLSIVEKMKERNRLT